MDKESIKYRKERIDRGVFARSADIFAVSSWQEITYLLLPRVIPFLILLVLPIIFEFSGNSYWAKVIVVLAILGIMAMSWDLLRIVGMFSLGQAFFFRTGQLCFCCVKPLSQLADLFDYSSRIYWRGIAGHGFSRRYP